MNKNVVVILVYFDDEILGLGGILVWYWDVGDKIFWIIVINISIS